MSGEEGRERVMKQQRWSAALWVSDIPDDFEREMASTACGSCVHMKWPDREKNALLIIVDAKVSCSQHRIGKRDGVINPHT